MAVLKISFLINIFISILLVMNISCNPKGPVKGKSISISVESDNSTESSIHYGKRFFIENCSSCHSQNDGYNNAKSIRQLNEYDSTSLYQILSKVNEDTLHSNRYFEYRLDAREINSIIKYIKVYYHPRY